MRGLTARDVVGHMVQTQREMLNGHGVDLGDAPDLKADPAEAWRHHAGRVLHALADEALVGRTYDGHFGPTTVGETLEQFYVWDMLGAHRAAASLSPCTFLISASRCWSRNAKRASRSTAGEKPANTHRT